MSFKTEVVTVSNRLPEIIAALPKEADVIVERAAFNVQGIAMDLSRVDTGAMKGSWFVDKPSPLTRYVYNPVDYSVYNEFGTRKMSAQPMARPAAVAVFPVFVSEMSALEDKLD